MNFFSANISVVPTSLWLIFSACVLVLLVIDLSLFGKGDKPVSKKSALIESGLWIALALAFNAWFAFQYGKSLGIEFLTGYLVEKSLSVDNLFIILLIFSSFKIAEKYQHRVLFYGVLGAIVFRAIFILIGAQLLNQFHWLLYLFGVVLLITAAKLLFQGDGHKDVTDNLIIRIFKKFFPVTTANTGTFFIREEGILKATPLFLALIAIEVTDLIFAVDSIPAVFAITQDAFVAFASNILAILGMRALYFVLADWVGKLRYLKPGLAAVLAFISIKMLLIDIFKIPSWISLMVVFSILVGAALASWLADLSERKDATGLLIKK